MVYDCLFTMSGMIDEGDVGIIVLKYTATTEIYTE